MIRLRDVAQVTGNLTRAAELLNDAGARLDERHPDPTTIISREIVMRTAVEAEPRICVRLYRMLSAEPAIE